MNGQIVCCILSRITIHLDLTVHASSPLFEPSSSLALQPSPVCANHKSAIFDNAADMCDFLGELRMNHWLTLAEHSCNAGMQVITQLSKICLTWLR